MPLLDHITAVQSLDLPDAAPAAEICERLLLALLDAEGPPAEPVAGFSSEAIEGIARSPKGRPLFLFQSWTTGPWTCLRLDLPPISMGRPITIKNPTGKGPSRTVLDYQSAKFQNRVVAACQAGGLPRPPSTCRVCIRLDYHCTFVAWAPHASPAPNLRGDLDNYSKNILDGLQRSGLLVNDRGVADLHVSRDLLPPAARTLSDAQRDHLLAIRKASPELTQRQLAKAAGLSQRMTRHLLRAAGLTGRNSNAKPRLQS
jgi:Holliday junction resolvase RusA-like endonuclease